jgi:hypothetical protein
MAEKASTGLTHPTDARPGFRFNPGITTRDPENFLQEGKAHFER